MTALRRYSSEIKDDDWALVAPYLALVREDVPQRQHPLRDWFNVLRSVGHTGCQ